MDKDAQENLMSQRELTVLGDVKRAVSNIDLAWVRQCETLDQAIRMCWELRSTRYTQSKAARLLEIDPGYFSRCINEKGNFPPSKLTDLMDLCRNEIPLLWLAWRRGKQLSDQTPKRRASDWGGRRGQPQEWRQIA